MIDNVDYSSLISTFAANPMGNFNTLLHLLQNKYFATAVQNSKLINAFTPQSTSFFLLWRVCESLLAPVGDLSW